mmetsp:Transcript_119601/g.386143  ORF Transcript_119601/g.386143 Transcript_119601/m.386143 type:complete len:351 (+) Transcript_119601:239-1291(+)
MCMATSRPGLRMRLHIVRCELERQSHQASATAAPGKCGLCAGPAASPSRRFPRLSVTSRVARSPWQTLSSPSTKTLASVMAARGTTAANSWMSASSCASRSRPSKLAFRSSAGSSRKPVRPMDFRGPFRQSFRRSAPRCGTCSRGETPPDVGSSACTRHRCSSRDAVNASARPCLAAKSAMASVMARQQTSKPRRSSIMAAFRRSWRRCVCARKSTSALPGGAGACAPFFAAGREPPASRAWSSASCCSSPARCGQAAPSAQASSSSRAARASFAALTSSGRASMVLRSTPFGHVCWPLPLMHQSSVRGMPRMKMNTKRTRTRTWFSLLKEGTATLSSMVVGPSGLPYLA